MADTRVKVELELYNQEQWYGVIKELNQLVGRGNWRGQKHVKRKFLIHPTPLRIWFELADENIASFLQLKYSGLKSQKD